MKRTTLVIEEELLEKIKKRARREKRSLKECVNNILREGLKRNSSDKPWKLSWKTFAMGRPLVDLSNRDALYHLMEEK